MQIEVIYKDNVHVRFTISSSGEVRLKIPPQEKDNQEVIIRRANEYLDTFNGVPPKVTERHTIKPNPLGGYYFNRTS